MRADSIGRDPGSRDPDLMAGPCKYHQRGDGIEECLGYAWHYHAEAREKCVAKKRDGRPLARLQSVDCGVCSRKGRLMFDLAGKVER